MKNVKKFLPILGIAAFGVTAMAGLSTRSMETVESKAASTSTAQYIPTSEFKLHGGTSPIRETDPGMLRNRISTFWDGEGFYRSFNASDTFIDTIHNGGSEKNTFDVRSPNWVQTENRYFCFLLGGNTANFVNIYNDTDKLDIPEYKGMKTHFSSCNMMFLYGQIPEEHVGDEFHLFLKDNTKSGYGGVTFSGLQVNLTLEELAKAFSAHKNNLATFNEYNLTGVGTFNEFATNYTLNLYNTDDYYKEVREAEALLTDADDNFEYDDNLVNWAFDQTYSINNDNNRLTYFDFDNYHSDAVGKNWTEAMPMNKEGQLFLNADINGVDETSKYRFISNTFTLSGVGLISAKLGGNSAQLQLLDENNNVLVHTGDANPHFYDPASGVANVALSGSRCNTMGRTYLDCSAYIGQKVKVAIADSRIGGGWGLAYFDDVRTNYETYPTFQVDTFSQTWGENPTYYCTQLDYYVDNNETVTEFEEAYNFYRAYHNAIRSQSTLFTWCDLDYSAVSGLITSYNLLSNEAKALVDNSEDFTYGYGVTSENWYLNEISKNTIGESMEHIAAINETSLSNVLFGTNTNNATTTIVIIMLSVSVACLLVVFLNKKRHN